MRSGKHRPTRLSTYVRTHNTILSQFERDGFVHPDHGIAFEPAPGGLLLEGVLTCLGGVEIEVQKFLGFVTDHDDPLVETRSYRYNVVLRGVGNIVRYDSPHRDHRQEHHVHRYNVLEGDREGRVAFLHSEEEVPTLGEVIEEAREWYFDHLNELEKTGNGS